MRPGVKMIVAAGFAAGLIALAPLTAQAESHAGPDDAPGVSVVAFKSTARPFTETLILRGRTEADRRVEVRSEITGLVSSPPLRKGALVKQGDVLCSLSEGDRTAEAAEAQALLKEATQMANVAGELLERGFSSETTANTRNAALETARARVLRAELNLERLTIEAPFDGILETDTAELGSLLQSGSTCASLIALDPIKLVAFAPERSVDQLTVGASVLGRLITGREVTGEISFVARSADRDTRTYLVEAETPNDDLSIRDGMTAEILVSLEGQMAHLVPQTALTLNDAGAIGVRLNVDGFADFAPVETLRDEAQGVWIDGLPTEADIIVVGQEFITEGQKLDVEYFDPSRTQ